MNFTGHSAGTNAATKRKLIRPSRPGAGAWFVADDERNSCADFGSDVNEDSNAGEASGYRKSPSIGVWRKTYGKWEAHIRLYGKLM